MICRDFIFLRLMEEVAALRVFQLGQNGLCLQICWVLFFVLFCFVFQKETQERESTYFLLRMQNLELALWSCDEDFVRLEVFGCLLMLGIMDFCSKDSEDKKQYLEINLEDLNFLRETNYSLACFLSLLILFLLY